jgi:hypothetical protein
VAGGGAQGGRASGGAATSGGAVATGGRLSSGGALASGGAVTTGGRVSTGGALASGGAVQSAGGTSGLVDCDPRKVVCRRVAPVCDPGEVPSVQGTCYGACVGVEQCACDEAADCPAPDEYTCHRSARHCGPFVD